MRILMTGGGSGGHFYPIIAVAQSIFEISKNKKLLEPEVFFMSDNPFNERMLYDNGIIFKQAPAGKRRLYGSFQNMLDIPKTIIGCLKALLMIYKMYPDVVFSKGGYASFPAVFAARILGIPVVLHESDTVPGKVNAWTGKFAEKIAITFPETLDYFKGKDVALTGTPIRKEIISPVKTNPHLHFELSENIPTILILGGSLGAQIINENILDALPDLVNKFQIIHQTGKANFEYVVNTANVVLEKNDNKSRYKPIDYLDDLTIRYAAGAADIIVSRAGASAICEIAVWGIPSIIIPIAESNGNHQKKNAFSYNRIGACTVIDEINLSSHILISEINRIIDTPQRYESMKKSAIAFSKTDAASKIARVLVDLAVSHE